MALKKIIFFIPFAIVPLLMNACASAPPSKEGNIRLESFIKDESSQQVKLLNERILMSYLSTKQGSDRDYKIGPDDLLEISVFEEEKLNKTVRVSSQGNISLPLLGIFKVKGLTANELEKELRDLLTEKYLHDPHISVFIKEYRNQRISVIGAVGKPGVIDITGQKTILDILTQAGGLSTDAGPLLFLIRPPPLEEEGTKGKTEEEKKLPSTIVINLEELLIKGDLSHNIPLINGDVINVPVSGKIFVGGEVKTPGGYPLSGKKVTVSQAIAMAGGLTQYSDGAEAKIFRYIGKDSGKEIIPAHIYDIQKGKAEDLSLKENDIVIVPKSGMKTFFYELWDVVKGRIPGISFGAI